MRVNIVFFPLSFLCIAPGAIFVTSLCAGGIWARTIEPGYEIGLWKEFSTAAVSHTFDDACPTHFTIAVPLFDSFGMKLTLFVTTSYVDDWTQIRGAALNGHEIAGHTVTHASLNTLSDSGQEAELRECKETIDSNVAGYKCITMAYPSCYAGNEEIVGRYYIAARGCSDWIQPPTPPNFMDIGAILCLETTTAEDMNARVNEALDANGWCVFIFHGIDGDWMPVSSQILESNLEYINTKKDSLWVSTFGNVFRYIRERDSVSVTEVSNTGTTIIIRLTDDLPDSIYDFPISIRRKMPEGWVNGYAIQDGKAVETKVINEGGSTFLMFEAVPDGGDIVLSNSGTSSAFRNGPSCGLQIETPARQDLIPALIFDLRGAVLARLYPRYIGCHRPASGVTTCRFPNGAFILRVIPDKAGCFH